MSQQFSTERTNYATDSDRKQSGLEGSPIRFWPGVGLPGWVHDLRKGDELLKSDGRICIFERAMQKNIAFVDDQGKAWRGKPWGFKAWRRGSADNVKKLVAGPSEFKTDAGGARSLRPGQVALFMLSTSRIYIARVEGTPNAKTISARDLSGKSYRYPLNAFVMTLPNDKFPVS